MVSLRLMLFIFVFIALGVQTGCKSVFTVDHNGSSRQVISYGDSAVVFTTKQEKRKKSYFKRTRIYYYYNLQEIHATRGAFIGRPLNNKFIKQNIHGALLETGTFKSGLKHGVWYRWYNNGELELVERWRNGRGIHRKKVFDEKGITVNEYRWKNDKWVFTKRLQRKRERILKDEEKQEQKKQEFSNKINVEKVKRSSFFSFKKSVHLVKDDKLKPRRGKSVKRDEKEGSKLKENWFKFLKRNKSEIKINE